MSELKDAFDWATNWHNYIRQVREKVYQQTAASQDDAGDRPQIRVRDTVIEAGTRQILANVARKVRLLCQPFDVETEDHAWDLFFASRGFIRSFLAEQYRSLFDKYLLGLGWLVLERADGMDYPRFVYVDPQDVLWHPDYRVDESPVYWRRIRLPGKTLRETYGKRIDGTGLLDVWLEYRKDAIRHFVLDRKEPLKEQENPCSFAGHRVLPLRCQTALLPGGVDLPINDYELGFPWEKLLNEGIWNILRHARNDRSGIFIHEDALDPDQARKLTDQSGIDPLIKVKGEIHQLMAGKVAEVVQTPTLAAEWPAVTEMSQKQLDQAHHISDYDKGVMPEKQVRATEATLLAQRTAQYAQADQEEFKADAEWAMKAAALYVLKLDPQDRTFQTKEGEQTLPETPPEWMEIRSQQDTFADQQKAATLLTLFGQQFMMMGRMIDINSAFKLYLNKSGFTGKEIQSLEPKRADPNDPMAIGAVAGEAMPGPMDGGLPVMAGPMPQM